MDVAILEKEALNLPEAEMALLADRLLQTIGVEDETRLRRWADEGERRIQAVREGRLATDDGDTSCQRLRTRIGQ